MLGSTLARSNYILLTTFRKNGQPVSTPLWFVLADDKRAYFMTGPETGKAKRMRNNPSVQVAPCNPRGKAQAPAVDAGVRMLGEPEAAQAQRTLARKYGWQWTLFRGIARLRGFKNARFYELSTTANPIPT